MQIRLSDNMSPVFADYHTRVGATLALERKFIAPARRYVNHLTEGGRGSFKTSTNAIELALLSLIPNTDIIVLRENYTDHKDSTFSELVTAFERIGLKLRPGTHYSKSNDLWIRLPNKSRIRFYGDVSRNYENVKGKTASPGNVIRAVWFFEITQFNSDFCMEQIEASFLRGDKGEEGIFKIFYEWNPPEAKSHWVNEWRDKKKQLPETNYIYVNYNDHPVELQKKWLGELMLNKIEGLKLIDEDMYKHIYLGESITLGGKIYKKFRRDLAAMAMIPDELRDITTDLVKIGVDTGYRDRMAFTASLIAKNFGAVFAAETSVWDNGTRTRSCSLRGKQKGEEYDPNDAVKDMFEFAKLVRDKYNKHIQLELESADDGFYRLAQDYQTTNRIGWCGIRKVNKAKKDAKSVSAIQERINFENILIGAEKLFINPKCVELINAFEDAVYDKNGKRKDDETTTYNDILDSFEYSVLEYLKNMQTRILYIKGKGVNV